MKANSYEGQLTGEELAQVHELLRQPGMRVEEAKLLAPPWKTGALAGRRVSHQTLAKIRKRLYAERRAGLIATKAKLVEAVAAKIKEEPGFSENSAEMLDKICTKWGQEILKESMEELDGKEKLDEREKVAKAKVLLKRADQLLASAKFRRETCEVFMKWYEDERARRILEGRESAAAKLQELGKLIYGEEW